MFSFGIVFALIIVGASFFALFAFKLKPNGLNSPTEFFSFLSISLSLKNSDYDIDQQNKKSSVKLDNNTVQNLDSEIKSSSQPDIIILFGSQSGTAESFAYDLEREAKSYNLNSKVFDLEDFDCEELASFNFVTLLIATHGEGEPTDSSERFWEWVKSDERSESLLEKMNFSIFGLGNKQYEFYNEMAKKVRKNQLRLGANEVIEMGLGDDDACLEDDFAEQKQSYQKQVIRYLRPDSILENKEGDASNIKVHRIKFEPKYEVKLFNPCLSEEEAEICRKYSTDEIPLHTDKTHQSYLANVIESRELQSNTSPASTMHMEIDIEGLGISYHTADTLVVSPRNDYKIVARLCKRLSVNPNLVFQFKSKNSSAGHQFSILEERPHSVKNAFLQYLDITNIPRKSFVQALAQYAKDEEEEKRLLELTSDQNKDEQTKYISSGISVLDILLDFKSIDIKFSDFIELSPRLQPREYTISSSNLKSPKKISITYNVLEETNKNGCAGVCTRYLKCLRPGKDKLAVFVKESSFRYPPSLSMHPIIMIGPGTGLAPFRGFIEDGNYMLKTNKTKLAEWVLFFGCRNRSKDYIYEEELQAALSEENGCLDRLFVAFSRDQPHKIYVQDLLQNEADLIQDLFYNQKAFVYICGGTAMGRSVRQNFVSLISKRLEKSEEEALEMLHSLQHSNRFVQELQG